MEIIYNSIIPPKGFIAINLFGVIFARKGTPVSRTTLNHESIHTAQMKELLYVPFYLWYFLEWLVRIPKYGKLAYASISFEQEAYRNASDSEYLAKRKRYAWIKYL